VTAAAQDAEYGVLLPSFDPLRLGGPSRLVEGARLADELGFAAGWTPDHIACPAPGLDSMVTLAAAAAVTDRLALGVSVMVLGLRAPAWSAKQIASVDALAPGRVRLGVGVGGEFPQEFEASGVPVNRRGALLDDALTVLPDLLAGRPVDHTGRAISVHAPALEPAMAAPPPVYVGGRGEAALRRTARFGDVWLPMWLSPGKVAERSARLAEMALEQSRPCPRVAMLVLIRIDDDRGHARAQAEAHVRGQYEMAFDLVERWAVLDSIGGAVERLSEYVAVGVSEFILLTVGEDPLVQYERLAELNVAHPATLTASSGSPE
jgi:alkanesulfonate monooxygenase SsuD/methylene tetrahydromethanopterin reductase-like flavin-dependent oxidoreductase (luciferase family)